MEPGVRVVPDGLHRRFSFNPQSCIHNWRIWFKSVAAIAYLAILIVFLPWWIARLLRQEVDIMQLAFLVAGGFLMMTLPFSLYEIAGHIGNYSKPYLQKHIIRILWMVPIYSINSWISLSWHRGGFYLDVVRECYEAYVIYNFMMFLLNYLFYDQDYDPTSLGQQNSVKFVFPLCFLSPCQGGMTFIDNCRHGILQYTVVRPVTTFISVVAELNGSYGEGKFVLSNWFLWIVLVNNISQFVAMYSLVMFYKAYQHYLAPMSPIGKFICIKAVIFFSFFQRVIISILAWQNMLDFLNWNNESTSPITTRHLQDFLICVEMFIAAIAHHYSFSYKPYMSDRFQNVSFMHSLLAMVDVSDVTSDVQQHIRVIGNSVTALGSRRPHEPYEEEHLLRPMVTMDEDDLQRRDEANRKFILDRKGYEAI